MATQRTSLAVSIGFEAVPAALLAGAVWYVLQAAAPFGASPLPWLAAAIAGMLGWFALHGLGHHERPLPMPAFQPLPIDELFAEVESELSELLLTETVEAAPTADDTLLLDDPIAAPDPDSRVVHLFDPARMPTAGELHSRIERHLHGDAAVSAAAADATEELHQALMELRRSLR